MYVLKDSLLSNSSNKVVSVEEIAFDIKVPDVKYLFTESLFIYNALLKNRLALASRYEKSAGFATGERKKVIESVIHAISQNSLLIKEVVDSLNDKVGIEDLLNFQIIQSGARGANDLSAYLKDFTYLRRDWCGLEAGERQVKVIVDRLKDSIVNFLDDRSTCLFLGAGLGRIAWEHTDVFDRVFALDKSYSMVYHFHKLLKEDLEFYEINTLNVAKPKDSIRKLRASIRNGSELAYINRHKFSYILGDVLSLPFPDNSLSCIASVYFSDVLALKLYMSEIIRTLEDGGLFIHFGPLDYFFSEISEMLTVEEMKRSFIKNGFEIVDEGSVETAHLESSLSMMKKTYNNSVFVAKKITRKNIEAGTKYIINSPLYKQTTTPIGERNGQRESINLISPSGRVYENSESVFEILTYFKKGISIVDALEKIEMDLSLSREDLSQVSKTLKLLIKSNILKEG